MFNIPILVHSKISANLVNLHAECYLRINAKELVIFIMIQYLFTLTFQATPFCSAVHVLMCFVFCCFINGTVTFFVSQEDFYNFFYSLFFTFVGL